MSLGGALPLLGLGWGIAAGVMLALWFVQRRTRDATAVDVAWAFNLGLLALVCAALGDGLPARRALLAGMVVGATWRLALHLWVDRARKGSEDGRYAALRAQWGERADARFFWFFQAQALLDALLAVPFALAALDARPLGALDLVALALWSVGVCGETLADRQLAAFRADPAQRGRTCRRGLWNLSRHPNYFFQWLLWCAYALLALGSVHGWLALTSPLSMLALILFVTGIPPTEAQALRSRGEDYREYQRTTSAFVPWFPRRNTQRRTA